MSSAKVLLALVLVVTFRAILATDFPVQLDVQGPLNSRSANIHLSRSHKSIYPFAVTYGACDSLGNQDEDNHISRVEHYGINRLVWLLPDNISSRGCLSAWSSANKLLGRSQELAMNKNSRQWLKKRHLENGTRLSKRASIPMTGASGIDAEGPWFDGVEALREREDNAVDAAQAKAKSTSSNAARCYPKRGQWSSC